MVTMSANDSLAALMSSLPDDERRQVLDEFPAESFYYEWWFHARADQLAPPGDWRAWVILAGRGWGKTRTGAEWVRGEVEAGRRGRLALIGATAADVRDVMIEGESGIMATARPSFRPVYEPSKRRVSWPNGAIATAYSADEPDRLRGPQHDGAWPDELAAWRYPETLDMLMMGLRLGDDPRLVVTTTPRPTKVIKDLIAAPTSVLTRGSTYDNLANLAPAFAEQIIRKYEGTRLGRQELLAEILTDVPGALWTYALLEGRRPAPDLVRCVVGVDPSGGSDPENDEQGIIVGGKGVDGHGYVVADRSCRLSPDGWGRRAVQAYVDFRADAIVVERNFGGDMAEAVIKSAARAMGVAVTIIMVTASRGKAIRAQPVAALYEQQMMHHVEVFETLEEQQCVVAGTMVMTTAGDIPIERVAAGDVVWTREGWRPVEWAGQTGQSNVLVEIEASNGSALRCTPTHPIWVDGRGFIPAIEVQTGCIIQVCQYQSRAHTSNITASNTFARPSTVAESITALPVADPARDAYTMWSSMRSITGPYRRGGTSIIVTGMDSITTHPTCSDALSQITSATTADPGAQPRHQPKNAARAEKLNGPRDNRAHSSVSSVAPFSSRSVLEPLSALAVVNAITVRYGPVPETVFNLTVGGCPEFVANGIVVHNCTWTPESGTSPDRLDALVWMVTETMLGEKRGWGAV